MIRKWDIKDEQAKRQCVDEVIQAIDEHGEGQFGIIAAEEIIDIVAVRLGPQIYNDAIEDAKKLLETKLSDLTVEMDVLKTTE